MPPVLEEAWPPEPSVQQLLVQQPPTFQWPSLDEVPPQQQQRSSSSGNSWDQAAGHASAAAQHVQQQQQRRAVLRHSSGSGDEDGRFSSIPVHKNDAERDKNRSAGPP